MIEVEILVKLMDDINVLRNAGFSLFYVIARIFLMTSI